MQGTAAELVRSNRSCPLAQVTHRTVQQREATSTRSLGFQSELADLCSSSTSSSAFFPPRRTLADPRAVSVDLQRARRVLPNKRAVPAHGRPAWLQRKAAWAAGAASDGVFCSFATSPADPKLHIATIGCPCQQLSGAASASASSLRAHAGQCRIWERVPSTAMATAELSEAAAASTMVASADALPSASALPVD